ncbi:MAG TPA: zinc ribbon domain-containing protein [Streptosporangiaceae bacterium]
MTGPGLDLGVVVTDERSAPFFAAAARDELLIKRCGTCGHWLGPEATGCPACGDDDPAWAVASGRATVVSWSAVPGQDGVPALVELEEGPWLHTCLTGVDAGVMAAGLAVSAVFVHPAEGESYPVFGLVEPDGARAAG